MLHNKNYKYMMIWNMKFKEIVIQKIYLNKNLLDTLFKDS